MIRPWHAPPPGSRPLPGGGAEFSVWAPAARQVSVDLQGGGETMLTPRTGGWHQGLVSQAGTGSLYRYRLDGNGPFPDPASRFQPLGPHGPSEVVDPRAYAWTDGDWPGIRIDGQVIYEMHVGTFTPEGTYAAAQRRLADLAELGIGIVELMPLADFPGRFGWGYDGVNLFAPTRLYGRPDQLRAFVDHAHSLGLGVILDVVYNHLGPDGNFLGQFSPSYFTDRYSNEWGEAIDFDGPQSEPVRDFFAANAAAWITEYHMDGLRLDATQSMHDHSAEHILARLARVVRQASDGREVVLIGENEPQNVRLVRPLAQGGFDLDALWNDDFHHSAMVAATGRREAYYSDHRGRAQEFVSAFRHGFLFQGQRYLWQGKRRGSPAFGLAAKHLVTYLQNHDQVANSIRGERLHQLTAPGLWRALTALLLLGPATPMLFQGQEFAASAPFLYFADHLPGLAGQVEAGRRQFLAQFPSIGTDAANVCLHRPNDQGTFRACVLDWSEREHERHAEALALHRDLLALRRADPVFAAQGAGGVDGATLSEYAAVLRWFGGAGDDRLMLLNLSGDVDLASAAEPLLAPPENRRWAMIWSSEAPIYGGCGSPPPEQGDGWRLPAHSAIVLAAEA